MGPDMASAGPSLFAVHGILGALYHKWRTGEGQRIDVSMLATMIHQKGITWTSMIDPDEWAGFYCESYVRPPETGYNTADQPVTASAPRDPDRFRELMKAIDIEDYLEHPLFQNPPSDLLGSGGIGDMATQAKPIWEEAFTKRGSDDLLELIHNCGAIGSQINTYQQLLSHPQMKAWQWSRKWSTLHWAKYDVRLSRGGWMVCTRPLFSPAKSAHNTAPRPRFHSLEPLKTWY